MINICIINLTHAYNNWQLLGKLNDDYVFGQEHSNNAHDRQKVRKSLNKVEIHFSELDPEHHDKNVGGLMMMNSTKNKNIMPNPRTKAF